MLGVLAFTMKKQFGGVNIVKGIEITKNFDWFQIEYYEDDFWRNRGELTKVDNVSKNQVVEFRVVKNKLLNCLFPFSDKGNFLF